MPLLGAMSLLNLVRPRQIGKYCMIFSRMNISGWKEGSSNIFFKILYFRVMVNGRLFFT